MNALSWAADSLAHLTEQGLRRELRERGPGAAAGQLEIAGRSLVNFGSNDYLGLAQDARVAAAARDAIERFGWGAGASPLVTGRTTLHAELERRLAAFECTEAALLFPSGYAANVGTITALAGKGDAVYSDALNHASMIDGCRLSGAAIYTYPHNDVRFLEAALKQTQSAARKLIVTDGLFSMTGDLAPLVEVTTLAEQHGAMLLIDEAHATGVLGEHGRGAGELAGVRSDCIVKVGTLSKALGSIGGFVASSRQLIDWLANRARPYVFSTAMPPAAAAAGIKAIELVEQEPERRRRVLETACRLGEQLLAAGMVRALPQSQIVPVVLGSAERTMAVAAALVEQGFFVPGIRPPSVPEGTSLLRISLSSEHSEEQMASLVAAIARAVA